MSKRRIMGWIEPEGEDREKACADEVAKVESILSACSAKPLNEKAASNKLAVGKREDSDGKVADAVLVDLTFATVADYDKAMAELKKEKGCHLRAHICNHFDNLGNPLENPTPCVPLEEINT